MVPTYKTKLNREELCVAAMNEKDTMTRPFKTNILFNTGDWDTKVGTQVIPGVTDKFDLGIQNEAGQMLTVLSREHSGHRKHRFPIIQEMTLHMDITRWSISKSN